MAVSKRLRYEVLRRDNHACRYCGAAAPDVKLTVDHVMPVALGGSDDASNLVTACVDCNAGKSSSNPDAPMVEDVVADALRWSLAIEHVAAEKERDRAALDEQVREVMSEWWDRWNAATTRTIPDFPADAEESISRWLSRGLPVATLKRMAGAAIAKYLRTPSMVRPDVWPYYAGCCSSALREIQDAAKEMLSKDES